MIKPCNPWKKQNRNKKAQVIRNLIGPKCSKKLLKLLSKNIKLILDLKKGGLKFHKRLESLQKNALLDVRH